MHTLTTSDDTVFNYHGDFSGSVTIKRGENSLKVPYVCLDTLVRQKILQDIQEAIEGMDTSELVSLVGKSGMFDR